jgi:hypothetical protein
MVMPNWTPSVADGQQWTATAAAGTATQGVPASTFSASTVGTSSILYPLVAAGLQKKTLIVTGLDHESLAVPTPACAGPPGGHGAGTGCFLNMLSVNCNDTSTARTSLDQMLLPVLNAGASPLLPTGLQVGLQGDNGLCDAVNCNFSRMISWKKGVAMPVTADPQQVFLQLFGSMPSTGAPTPASTAAAAARFAQQKSILDAVLADSTSLSAKLSPGDNIQLQQYQQAVRDLEVQLQNQSTAAPLTCTTPAEPAASVPLNFNRGITPSTVIEGHMPLLNQMMGLAFTCDITRAVTFMLGNGTSNNDYQFLIGQSTPHHGTSHHGGNPTKLADLTMIDTWEILQVATLLKSLDSTMDVDGKSTVLDNTVFYLSSDIGDGATHNHWDMPVLLAGGASGLMKIDGRHVNYYSSSAVALPRTSSDLVGPRNPSQSTGQVHVSILNAYGITPDTIGEVTGGPLTELLMG